MRRSRSTSFDPREDAENETTASSASRLRAVLRAVLALVVFITLWMLIVNVPEVAIPSELALVAAVVVAALVSVPIGILVAIELPPVKPLAQTSILGKNVVAFGKLAIGILAFFGNTALTWIIALNVAAKPNTDVAGIHSQLWPLLATLVGAIAYVFWVWIAFDLARAGRQARTDAVDALADRARIKFGVPTVVDRAMRRFAKWVISGPWWRLVLGFVIAPAILVATVTATVR